jgi:flavin reductase (DIM6/NTAB) family NADH-FMN oxidoreductase RutF
MSTSLPPTVSLNVSDFSATEMYFLLRDSILPRPIAWVSTISQAGVSNIAPFSYFNVCCNWPPVMGFSCGPRASNHPDGTRQEKDTWINICDNRQFVINVSPEQLMDQMVASSDDLPHGESEFAMTGLQEVPSTMVKPPRVALTPIAFECELLDSVDLGESRWIMGKVVHVHIHEHVYRGTRQGYRHRVDLLEDLATRPVGRLGRAFYVRLRELETRLRKDGPN